MFFFKSGSAGEEDAKTPEESKTEDRPVTSMVH